jgi:phage shock protein C
MGSKNTYKTLYRSKTNKTWLGVCGGLGEYLNIDPVVIRLLLVLITALTGFFPGLIVYLVSSIIIPEKS